MKYLFDDISLIQKKLSKIKEIFIFLDFDGTLVPIVSTPDKVSLNDNTRSLLTSLSCRDNYKISIISGRELKDVKKYIGLKNIYYSGNHGMEIEGPGIKYRNPSASRFLKILKELKKKLHKELNIIDGVLIEDKKLTLSIHYRMVLRKDIKKMEKKFNNICKDWLNKGIIKVTHGKKVYEVRPPVIWHKGRAVSLIRSILFEHDSSLSIYVGDDTTDEDAFRELGNNGISIVVGKKKTTCANYYLKNQKEVEKLLTGLNQWI